MTPECLACQEGMSVADYLKQQKGIKPPLHLYPTPDQGDVEESNCSVHIENSRILLEQRNKCNNKYNYKIDAYELELNNLQSELAIEKDNYENLLSKKRKELTDTKNNYEKLLSKKRKELTDTKKECSIEHAQLLSRISELNNTIASKSNCKSFKFGKKS